LVQSVFVTLFTNLSHSEYSSSTLATSHNFRLPAWADQLSVFTLDKSDSSNSEDGANDGEDKDIGNRICEAVRKLTSRPTFLQSLVCSRVALIAIQRCFDGTEHAKQFGGLRSKTNTHNAKFGILSKF
jgi:hypothetical protein